MTKFEDLTNNQYIQQLSEHLDKLIGTPGPSRSVAKISANDPRIGKDQIFDMTKTLQEIIDNIRVTDKTDDLHLKEHNGNLVLFGGLNDSSPTPDQIKRIPVTFAAHADEITYMISTKTQDKEWLLIPLCSAPKKIPGPEKKIPGSEDLAVIPNNKVDIYRYGKESSSILKKIGSGEVTAISGEEDKMNYFLKTDAEVDEGDLVIQDYGPYWTKKGTLEGIVRAKALDDRVGCLVQIYAVRELVKVGFPAKAILAGDEEGVNKDVAWARLIRPTFRKYCDPNGIIIICDGVDGSKLGSFKSRQHLKEALIVAYTSHGVGAGDPGMFSLLKGEVKKRVVEQGHFKVKPTTAYASRSIDPKLMDEFPYIGFVEWSNGVPGFPGAVCHREESVAVEQLVNLIGTMTYIGMYFKDHFK